MLPMAAEQIGPVAVNRCSAKQPGWIRMQTTQLCQIYRKCFTLIIAFVIWRILWKTEYTKIYSTTLFAVKHWFLRSNAKGGMVFFR